MRYGIVCLFVLLASLGLDAQVETSTDKKTSSGVPKITFKENNFELGDVRLGETRALEYEFTNTGTDTLIIELVTSCHCTEIDWPNSPMAPGDQSTIKVTYDSTGQKLGDVQKVIDIISNTDPIVVEAFFSVTVVE